MAHQHTTGHPAPVPHPAPHRVDAREAEHIALDVAAQRGYRDPYVRDLKWKDNESRWDVKTEGYVARKKSKLDLWIDGETGEILKLKDQADSRKHGHAGHHGALPPGLAKKHKPDKGDHRGDKGDQHGHKGDQHGNKSHQHGKREHPATHKKEKDPTDVEATAGKGALIPG